MFGRQAIRLLREAWGGVIQPDAEGSLREKGAKQLAEELYAMFDSDIPLEHDGPITINKGSNATPLTINNNSTGPSLEVQGPSEFTGDFTVGGTGDITIVGDTITIGRGEGEDHDDDPSTAPADPSDIDLIGGSLDLDFGEITIGGVPLEDYIAGLGGGGGVTSVFLGRVVSGSGDTYSVALYGNGSGQASTATVTATVPQFDVGESLPPDTWIGAVHKFTNGGVVTYEFQPPVWL